jgi:hypothetical protein
MTAIYSEFDMKANCFMIADRFAKSIERAVNRKTVSGSWTGSQFEGKFMLTGGVKVYKLYSNGGNWSVVSE